VSADRERRTAILVLSLLPAAVASTRVIDALFMAAGVVLVLMAMSLLLPLTRRLDRVESELSEASTGETLPREGSRAPFLWGALLLSSCFTAIYELVLNAVAPAESSRLGIYVPLIAVSLLTMGRLDALGVSGTARRAAVEALRAGAAFSGLLVAITLVREVLGSGSITLGATVGIAPIFRDPARALGLAGGALICLGYAAGALRLGRKRGAAKGEEDQR
jgi:electron transport complex protein RnfE